MWTRKELKTRGRESFKRNYWKCVLVALVFALVSGSAFGGSRWNNGGRHHNDDSSSIISMDMEDFSNGMSEGLNEMSEGLSESLNELGAAGSAALIAGFVVGVIVVMLIVFAVILLLNAFLLNPLELGSERFFLKNLNTNSEVSELAFAFDHGYKNIAKTLFFRDLYTALWALLFVIPGIVKAYEYRMMPYILSENPELPMEEVFARSKAMMNGQKWNAFVLDLSFIGWYILSGITAGILAIFYVNPYKRSTDAALYETLKNNEVANV